MTGVRAIMTAAVAAAAALAPWLDLAIRIWLAKAFLATAVVGMVMQTSPAMTGTGPVSHAVNILVASPLGTAVQALCPLLLLMGLLSRFVAVPLLIQACVLPDAAAPMNLHLSMAILLGRILVFGPGEISLDALFRHGLVTGAIPGATRLSGIFAATERVVGPVFELSLRLWIASALLGSATTIVPAVMRENALASWFAGSPGPADAIAPGLALAVALLLLCGLGTRLTALTLLGLAPILQATMSLDDHLFWLLLLSSLMVHGPGSLSVDRWVGRWTSRASRVAPSIDPGLPHVVIVGGGFGGAAAARGLKATACRVTVVDRHNHHLFQPLLYQVATAGLSPSDIATPIRSLFRQQANVRVRLADVDGVRPRVKEITFGDDRLSYDYLVLATGAQHSYFGRDDWAASAPGLKTIGHATEIRRRLLTAFERAEALDDATERGAWTTFVIVGGGPTGVELAGAIAELARHGLKNEFRSIDPAAALVILIQSAPRLLPSFAESLSDDAEAALRALGVDVRLGAKVEHVDGFGVTVGGERLATRTVLWAAGVAASPAGQWLGAKTDAAGRIAVDPDLSVPSHRDIFAIGDLAACTAWNGKPVPGLAPAAKQAGAYVAEVIGRRVAGRSAPKPFRYRHAGSLATIGRRAAVVEFGPLRFRGAVAWWIWGLAHIVFLVGGRNRAMVALQWLWAYLTYGRGTRLITDARTVR